MQCYNQFMDEREAKFIEEFVKQGMQPALELVLPTAKALGGVLAFPFNQLNDLCTYMNAKNKI